MRVQTTYKDEPKQKETQYPTHKHKQNAPTQASRNIQRGGKRPRRAKKQALGRENKLYGSSKQTEKRTEARSRYRIRRRRRTVVTPDTGKQRRRPRNRASSSPGELRTQNGITREVEILKDGKKTTNVTREDDRLEETAYLQQSKNDARGRNQEQPNTTKTPKK